MTSTTEIGNSFRDAVCELLRTKFPDAKVEQRIHGTKVDILFTRDDELGAREIIAVECKDYAKPLTKQQISTEIYPQYNIMLANSSIQRVMIVSRKPLGADADAFICGWKSASHRTYEELAESLLGLRDYLRSLAALKPTGDIEYIDTRLEDGGGTALTKISEWVETGISSGIALLGSYGQGKTSFANRLAAHYAGLHLDDPSVRMPVLLRLGEVVHETQLEGLFGKEFTARHQAAGYHFRTFEHLNQAGRLLVILDGFDEMKHAMTAADFQANFREFNRLLVGKAKVVLLGRPNALPTESHDLVFRGTMRLADQTIQSSTFAQWDERRLAFFSPEESRHLLRSTIDKLMSRSHAVSGTNYPAGFLDLRVDEAFKEVPEDLLRRPVHLIIVGELASNPDFSLKGFNEYSLYNHFIRTLVERDTREKRARRVIGLDARLQFQLEVAWWAWRRTGSAQGHFHRREIPPAILEALPAGNAADEEGKLNEYVVSTLTEAKESGVLFFAHRSFQEFLVAERVRLTTPTPAAHAEYSTLLNPDILSFLQQAPSQDFMDSWYETLRASSGPIEATYLDFFARSTRVLQRIEQGASSKASEQIDAWTVCILFSAYRQGTPGAPNADHIDDFLLECIRSAPRSAAATAALAMLQLFATVVEPIRLERIAAAMLERVLSRARLGVDGHGLLVPEADNDFAVAWLKTVSKLIPKTSMVSEFTLNFKLSDLERACIGEVHPTSAGEIALNPFGDLPPDIVNAVTSVPAMRLFRNLPDQMREDMKSFLTSPRPKFGVVSVARQLVKSTQPTKRA